MQARDREHDPHGSAMQEEVREALELLEIG
jgi:hypothetical protein